MSQTGDQSGDNTRQPGSRYSLKCNAAQNIEVSKLLQLIFWVVNGFIFLIKIYFVNYSVFDVGDRIWKWKRCVVVDSSFWFYWVGVYTKLTRLQFFCTLCIWMSKASTNLTMCVGTKTDIKHKRAATTARAPNSFLFLYKLRCIVNTQYLCGKS